ncbi:MAG: hypothetical protein WAV20_15795 [Blastocatellia bacterium]
MKHFGKSEDRAIATLLRARVSRPSNPLQACLEFDPDLANAYIERSLPEAVRSRYEGHLSECAACRSNVVGLTRLAQSDVSSSISPAIRQPRPTLFAGAKQMLGTLSPPQWAMAAVAVIVLAISIPLVLSPLGLSSRNDKQLAKQVSEPAGVAAPAPETAVAPTTATPAAHIATSEPDRKNLLGSTRQQEKRETETVAGGSQLTARNAGVPGGVAGSSDQSGKLEAKTAPPPEETRSEGQPSKQPAQAPPTAESHFAKNDLDKARQQQDKETAQAAAEAKPGRADEPREKEKDAKGEDVAAPPPAASTSELARGRGASKRSPAKLSLRDNGGNESVRPPEKRVNGKKFFWKDNTWTDKDFDPDKDLPVVTIIRDSNVYKEELGKRSGLKSYVNGFTPTDRAIIVYKGRVYKLIPQ